VVDNVFKEEEVGEVECIEVITRGGVLKIELFDNKFTGEVVASDDVEVTAVIPRGTLETDVFDRLYTGGETVTNVEGMTDITAAAFETADDFDNVSTGELAATGVEATVVITTASLDPDVFEIVYTGAAAANVEGMTIINFLERDFSDEAVTDVEGKIAPLGVEADSSVINFGDTVVVKKADFENDIFGILHVFIGEVPLVDAEGIFTGFILSGRVG
jgi:hypothetical protein